MHSEIMQWCSMQDGAHRAPRCLLCHCEPFAWNGSPDRWIAIFPETSRSEDFWNLHGWKLRNGMHHRVFGSFRDGSPNKILDFGMVMNKLPLGLGGEHTNGIVATLLQHLCVEMPVGAVDDYTDRGVHVSKYLRRQPSGAHTHLPNQVLVELA